MNKRIEYIDLAKAVTIILVIVGHCYWHGILLDKLIYAFHMPLFFMLSGYFIKQLTLAETVRKYSHAYIKPYIITCVIILFISIGASVVTKADIFETIKIWTIQTVFASGLDKGSELWATTPMVGMIWFLIALFWSCVIYSFLKRYNSKVRIFISSLIFVVGCVSVLYIRLPFSLQAGMGGVLFLNVGDEIREHNIIQKFIDLKNYSKLLLFLYFIAIAICLGGVSVTTCFYGGKSLLLKLPMCIIACVAILSVCKMNRLGGAELEEIPCIF